MLVSKLRHFQNFCFGMADSGHKTLWTRCSMEAKHRLMNIYLFLSNLMILIPRNCSIKNERGPWSKRFSCQLMYLLSHRCACASYSLNCHEASQNLETLKTHDERKVNKSWVSWIQFLYQLFALSNDFINMLMESSCFFDDSYTLFYDAKFRCKHISVVWNRAHDRASIRNLLTWARKRRSTQRKSKIVWFLRILGITMHPPFLGYVLIYKRSILHTGQRWLLLADPRTQQCQQGKLCSHLVPMVYILHEVLEFKSIPEVVH